MQPHGDSLGNLFDLREGRKHVHVKPMQHPAGNELFYKWLTSLPDDCYSESYDSLPFMAHQQQLAPV